jgi:hypothetical protein
MGDRESCSASCGYSPCRYIDKEKDERIAEYRCDHNLDSWQLVSSMMMVTFDENLYYSFKKVEKNVGFKYNKDSDE